MARSLNPTEGGSDSRNLATAGKLQLLEQICGTYSGSNGNTDPVIETSRKYVGIVPQLPDSINSQGKEKRRKSDDEDKNQENGKKKRKK